MDIEPRYFIDERGGCIAVRDRENTDQDYPGLHEDTQGVVWFRMGKYTSRVCLKCRSTLPGGWDVSDEIRAEAKAECARLNDSLAEVSR